METELSEQPTWKDPIELKPITSQEECRILSEHFLVASAFQKEVVLWFADMKEKAYASHRTICKKEKYLLDKAALFKGQSNRLIMDWEQGQERIRKAEELRLQEKARKLEEEARLEEAGQAETEGKMEEAQAIISEPVDVPHVVVPKTTQKVIGMASVENWHYELIDAKKLKPDFLLANDLAIGSLVRSMKKQAEGIVGDGAIRVYSEKKKRATRR